VSKDSPYKINNINHIHLYAKPGLGKLSRLIREINPDFIIVSGWNDFHYIKILLQWYKKTIILCMDNRWCGSLKQHAAAFAGKILINKLYNYIFIPGAPQKEYAIRLGFSEKRIIKGYYSANLSLFHKYHERTIERKVKEFPHRFLFVGRYIEVKRIMELVYTFIESLKEKNSDWELWCVGTGPLLQKMPVHPQIRHFGFIQPSEMGDIIQNTGVFILPSSFEPWGVVVHEFAAAGYPLICSDKIGAASEFLEDGINGFSYKWDDKVALKRILQQVMAMSAEALLKMSENSLRLSNKITPQQWASTLYDLRKDK
jgi:glycosyltransferase involved in cell wall biosynthesis